MQIINASQWTFRYSTDKCAVIYSATGQFKDVTIPWQEHYQPFAIVETITHTQQVIAYRDHFGFEPFYYYCQHSQFIFGSSIPDILKRLSKTPLLNEARILQECFRCDQLDLAYSHETYYQGIYRLEPGTMLIIKNGKVRKKVFWQPEAEGELLCYASDHAYVEHFTELFHHAVQNVTKGHTHITAECSGGIDSTAVITACQQLCIQPTLLSHIASKDSEEQDDLPYIHCLINHLGITDIHYLDAKGFDPIAVFQYCALQFAGSAPFMFFMLANNVHQAVVKNQASILLSGFGGDECVSGHAIPRAYFPELLAKKQYRTAWYEICHLSQPSCSTIKATAAFLKYSHPSLYALFNKVLDMKLLIKNYFSQHWQRKETGLRPYYKSVRQFEADQLKGHALRMRIEYSAVLAKSMGFRYGYPLLQPKLIEFGLSLPLAQKRRRGINRYLIRQYLANYLPRKMVDKVKIGGGIMPATFHLSKEYLKQEKFSEYFTDLPFSGAILSAKGNREELKANIAAYMLKYYAHSRGGPSFN